MKKANMLVISEKELRKELLEFSKPMMEDCIEDLIKEGRGGNLYLGEIIDCGGFENMTALDLAEISEPWAEFIMDKGYEREGDIDGIVLIREDGNQVILYEVEKEEVEVEEEVEKA